MCAGAQLWLLLRGWMGLHRKGQLGSGGIVDTVVTTPGAVQGGY